MAEKKAPSGMVWRWLREPAVFCDAFTLQAWTSANVVRFAFGEFTDSETAPFYRVGVVMPLSVAKRLSRSLNKAIKEAEQEREEEAASEES